MLSSPEYEGMLKTDARSYLLCVAGSRLSHYLLTATKAIISWLPHGRSWKVHNPQAFIENIIPAFFDYQNFNSFIRLVNAWGFRRLIKGPDRNSYYHELFLRGMPHLHERMRRLGTKEKKVVAGEPNLADFQPCPPLVHTSSEFASLGPQSRPSGGDAMPATETSIRQEILPGHLSSVNTLQRSAFLPVSSFLAGSRRSRFATSNSAGLQPDVWDSYPGLPLPSQVPPPAQPLDQFSLPLDVHRRGLLTQEERLVLLARNSFYGANTVSGSLLAEENRLSLLAAPRSAAFSSLQQHQEISDISSLLALHQAQQMQVGMRASQQRQQLLWDRALEELVSQERAMVLQQQLQQQQQQQQQRQDQLTIASAAAILAAEGRYEAPSHSGRSWLPILGPPRVQESTSIVPYLDPSSDTSRVDWMTGSAETFGSLMSQDKKPESSCKPSPK
jgi:HSF-type DNA-binding